MNGRKQTERLISRSGRFWEAWKQFKRELNLRELNIDPDKVFADVRAKP